MEFFFLIPGFGTNLTVVTTFTLGTSGSACKFASGSVTTLIVAFLHGMKGQGNNANQDKQDRTRKRKEQQCKTNLFIHHLGHNMLIFPIFTINNLMKITLLSKLFEQIILYLWFAAVTLLSLFQPAIATFSDTNHIRCRGLVFQTHTSSTYDQCLKIICTAATEGGVTTEEEGNIITSSKRD